MLYMRTGTLLGKAALPFSFLHPLHILGGQFLKDRIVS